MDGSRSHAGTVHADSARTFDVAVRQLEPTLEGVQLEPGARRIEWFGGGQIFALL